MLVRGFIVNKDQVIASVASDLNATEAALDAAIVQATTLVQSMIGARSALSLSPQTKAMEAIAALSAAREAVVGCHDELQKDHRRMGWGTYAAGPLDKPGLPMVAEPQPAAHLRAV